jgi:hypothetical protein
VRGGPFRAQAFVNPGLSRLIVTTVGFIAWGVPSTRLWWSPTGRSWYPVSAEGLPDPDDYDLEGLFADKGVLLAMAAATRDQAGVAAGTGSLWQVDLTGTE